MAAQLLTDASRAVDANGNPYDGAQWKFYYSGTTTPLAVYANADLSTSLGAVVTADAGGRFVPIYFDGAMTYRGRQEDKNGNLLPGMDIDPINVTAATGGAGGILDDGVWSPDAPLIDDGAWG